MDFDKITAICPDFIWLGFQISDPIQNPSHLHNIFYHLNSRIVRILDPHFKMFWDGRNWLNTKGFQDGSRSERRKKRQNVKNKNAKIHNINSFNKFNILQFN